MGDCGRELERQGEWVLDDARSISRGVEEEALSETLCFATPFVTVCSIALLPHPT